MGDADDAWLKRTEGIEDASSSEISALDFISMCLTGPAKGYIRYNATAQQVLTPNIVTLAAVLDAVPLEDGHPARDGAELVYDAVTNWDGFSALDATSFMYDNHVNETTTMAKMNPGYDMHAGNPLSPPLTKRPALGLTDFIVKERLFTFFLNNGCILLTKEHALESKIAQTNPWPRPIAVYGYDNSWAIAGDLWEAETKCVPQHNMGQIASENVNNLAFYSARPSITTPLVQNDDPPIAMYNKSKTYVSFIMGDGDNVAYMKGSRSNWMLDRVARCTKDPARCFPLSWSSSPHLLHAAPDWARWFYNQSYQTGRDYFVLPPSGHLYAYPSAMGDRDQASFVAKTEEAATLMGTNSVVAWEWFGTWGKAIKKYVPRYSQKGVVQGLYAVNVPYMIPIAEFGLRQQFKVLGEKQNVVLFRPNEWRGAGSGGKRGNAGMFTKEQMAKKINGFKKGTVSAFYTTSDGGLDFDLVYGMVQLLDEHVEIVNHNGLVEMALGSGDNRAADLEVQV